MPWFSVVSVVDSGKDRLAGGIWARSVWSGGGGIFGLGSAIVGLGRYMVGWY